MDQVMKDIQNQEQSKYQNHKESLQIYLFLAHYLFEVMQLNVKNKKSVGQWEQFGKKSSRSRTLNCFLELINLNLNVLFVSKSDLDFCISDVIFKSIRTGLESNEVVKSSAELEILAEIICVCASSYKSCQMVLLQHIDDFTREERLSDFIAVVLNMAAEKFECREFVQAAFK